ncbi:MAG: type IV pilin protein [Actinomycetota bacterium]
MLKKIREMKDQDGFTLIELMVVILIIAILIAIAIPTFLGLRQRAQNRAAQSNLRNAMTAAKAFYTDNESYVGFDAAAGLAIEPSLTWNDAAVSVTNAISVRNAAAGTVLVSTRSASGTFYCLAEIAPGTTGEGTGEHATAAACVAAADW